MKFSDTWHSWDSTPWQHPWLTASNLSTMRTYSEVFLDHLLKKTQHTNIRSKKIAFCGNGANNIYTRMVPLIKAGLDISLYLHPQTQSIFDYPAWEEFDGSLLSQDITFEGIKKTGIRLPQVKNVFQIPQQQVCNKLINTKNKELDSLQKKYLPYMAFVETYNALQKYDAVWCGQFPYFGYLAGKRYIASQNGGDIWFEASRGDLYGTLQREAFKKAVMIPISNPWIYAHARRFGFNNLINLPLIIDDEVYKPGDSEIRKQWIEKTKSNFFILSTSRHDDVYKGLYVLLKAFKEFCQLTNQARLVLIEWGNNLQSSKELCTELGIQDKILWLPLSGKVILREYLKSADCFVDQFILGYYGAAGIEAMACGLPVIARIEHAQYEAFFGMGRPPILNATTQEEVFHHLLKLVKDHDYKHECSYKHRQWFLANHGSSNWLSKYIAVLAMLTDNIVVDFSDSPLKTPLTSEELAYHQQGLKNAPEFPNYL